KASLASGVAAITPVASSIGRSNVCLQIVAVHAFSHTRGGRLQRAIASPNTRVESTRDSRISRRLRSLYRQFTDRPERLISARAPSSSSFQLSSVLPSHWIWRIAPAAGGGERVSTTTS